FEDFGVLVEGLLGVGAFVLVEPPLGCVALDAVGAAVYGNHHGVSVSPLPVWGLGISSSGMSSRQMATPLAGLYHQSCAGSNSHSFMAGLLSVELTIQHVEGCVNVSGHCVRGRSEACRNLFHCGRGAVS